MTPSEILILLFGVLAGTGIVLLMVLSGIIYWKLLVRTDKSKWKRGCSAPDDPATAAMFAEGMRWAETWAEYRRPVSVRSGRLTLRGEYFDFGSDSCVIVLPGRTESLQFSYYFGEPYRRAGRNVLVIDARAHGESDGRVNSLGFREYRDVLAWGKYLHEACGVRRIFLHGLCIGAETAILTLSSKRCPSYFEGMAGEGTFVNFYEMCRNHFLDLGHRPFPLLFFVAVWIFLCSGAWVPTDGPQRRVRKVRCPVLFLHSRADSFAKPEKTQKVFDACGAPKTVVWFDSGNHSRLRLTNSEKYDTAILDFLNGSYYNNIT